MHPQTIVISGASSSGKTSLAQALQEALLPDIWLAISVDTVIYSLPSSVLDRCNNQNDWSGVDGSAIFSGSTNALRALIDSGNMVIFDCIVMNKKQAKQLQKSLEGLDVLTIGLTCDLPILEKRAAEREDRTLKETQQSFETAHRHIAPHVMLDSSTHSPEQLAAKVIEIFKKTEPEKTCTL